MFGQNGVVRNIDVTSNFTRGMKRNDINFYKNWIFSALNANIDQRVG